ncbi:glycerophosphodiester phosphodiesterase [Brachybacterium sp.]|uniref:glycerophosphodiester phosphodiesterase n=1 Tax=Brachybacterium sp. TaxID=1891286 RepID=UPI002ED5407D
MTSQSVPPAQSVDHAARSHSPDPSVLVDQPVPAERSRPAIVGHRGASAHAPENTLGAFRRAIEDGAQLLECDVHLSADGEVVVMHDETIDRTAAEDSPLATGAIGELTRAQLDTVLLEAGERIPSLAELLEMTTVPVFIEVKVAAAARAVAEILSALPEGSPAAASTVISFHADALAEIRRAAGTPVSYLVFQVDEQAIVTARELGAAGIGPSIGGLSLRAAEAVHVAGFAVNPWTVNSVAQLEVALACDVDTITTDDPAWLQRELDVRLG